MIEVLKQLALTLVVAGVGLAILLPALVQLFVGAALASIIKPNTFKEKLSKVIILVLPIIGSLLYAAYYVGTLYYIWIK